MLDERQKAALKKEFERCSSMIATALTPIPGTHSMSDIEQACADGMMQLWPGKAAVILTEIVQHPHRKGCFVRALGGDAIEGAELGLRVAEWAKSIGCDHIMALGRPRWARELGTESISTLTIVDIQPCAAG